MLFISVGDDEEPIIPLPFYNPHHHKCPECGHEMKGELIDTNLLSITD